MYTFKEEQHSYEDALDLKHKETEATAKEHHLKQTTINMTFDTVEDVEGFTSTVFKGNREKVFTVEPSFMLPRKKDELFYDHSQKCVIIQYYHDAYFEDRHHQSDEMYHYHSTRNKRRQRSMMNINQQESIDNDDQRRHSAYELMPNALSSQNRKREPITPQDEFVYDLATADPRYTYNHCLGMGDESQDDVTQSNTLFSTPSAMIRTPSPKCIQKKKKWLKCVLSSTKQALKKKLGKGHPLPSIQVISATNELGDVLNCVQQKEIMSQLNQPLPSRQVQLSPEKTRITSLPRIWVFRLIEEGMHNDTTQVVWTGFDFENQQKMEKGHASLVLYDSHIGCSTMAVTVQPLENKGHYFTDQGQQFQEALSWLPVDERPSVMRFKFDRDRHLALASRLIRRYYFSRLLNRHWSDLEFTILPGGKPSLKGCSLDFNLSHESHWVIFGCVKE
ncbi:hypothetical protein CU098_009471, partial [Rhizopus stolonifer]